MAVDTVEAERFNQHKRFLEDYIEPDFGLLDKLQSKGILTSREISDIKDCHPFYKRNILLLQYIIEQNKFNKLLDALREANQVHLVNFVIGNGEYKADEFGDEWPLREEESSILKSNQEVLVDLIEPGDLIGRLFSKEVINKRQMDTISSKLACHEKNEVLLETLKRRSLKDFKVTIRCLRESNQHHIAQLLEQGGVVIRAHAEGLGDRTEDDIIASVTRELENKSFEESRRILESALNVIALKKGNSIVLYIYCKTVVELTDLKEMQMKGKLKTALQRMFTKLLTPTLTTEVTVDNLRTVVESIFTTLFHCSRIDELNVSVSEDEYKRCRSYFPAGIKLRAMFDFDPEQISEQQEIELRNILRSKAIDLKDKRHRRVKYKKNANRPQEEERTHIIEVPGKPEMGDYMLDEDQSGEAQRMWKIKGQKQKVRASVTEGENLKETEHENSDPIIFGVETIHEPALNLVEDLEEERLFHPQAKESKHESKELETSSESESEDSKISSIESEEVSEERLNPLKMAISFQKGDLMETIPPADIGDTITWWRALHLESGEVGYVPRRLVIIDYQRNETSAATSQAKYLKSATSNTSVSNLPLELLDSILQKSYLQRVLREEQVLKYKDYQTICQMASVDCCWFQRTRKRKFKKELWRNLLVIYRRKEKISSLYKINRQYFEENIRLKGLVNRLKSNDCLTDVQTASLYKQNFALGKKDSFKRLRDLKSEVAKKTEAMDSVFRRCLYKTKQYLISEVIENGGAMTKVEIKFQKAKTSVITRHQNLQIVERINEIRDKTKARTHQIEELTGKLKQVDLEIFSASQDGDVIIVWIWCKTKHALEKLQNLNKSKHIIEFFTELVKNLSFSSEERNPTTKVNIDFEQFEKTVVFFSIIASFTSRLNLRRKKNEDVKGVTKLRNKIHVLLHSYSSSSSSPCVILLFEDQIPFRLQKRIEIEEIKNPKDIASIEMENSLYVVDLNYRRECVWKIKEGDEEEKKKKTIRWLELRDYSVGGPKTLSVTRDGQLLLVCRRKDDPFLWSLWIFGGDSEKGDLRRSIPLPEDVRRPIHAVETSKGNFILIHQMEKKEEESGSDGGRRQLEKVLSEVSGDGKSNLRRFISKNEEQKLSSGHLAVDSFDRVFLTDYEKDRVILFDSDLQWKGILIPTKEDGKEGREILRPWSLFYDEEKKELIVGGTTEVFVYSLNRI